MADRERAFCFIEGCEKRSVSGRKGMCSTHYTRWHKWGDPLYTEKPRNRRCSIDGCDDKHFGRGWCYDHYSRWWRYNDPEWQPAPPPTVCSVDGCGTEPVSLGLCVKHYNRQRIHGSTDDPRPSVEERFWSKVVEIDGDGSCWLWTAAKSGKGYGCVVIDRRRYPAHRVAYEMFVGPIPEGLEIDHLCRVRNCVNPAHLEPVTHAENVRRAMKKVPA